LNEEERKTRYHMTGSGAWVEEPVESMKAKIFDKKEAEQVIEEVLRRLSAGSTELIAREITRDGLLTGIVISLEWDYQASITGFHNDQWSAVTAAKHDGTLSTWVECYSLEAGSAMTWKLFADREPKEPSPVNE
jgi:hypothetical protein